MRPLGTLGATPYKQLLAQRAGTPRPETSKPAASALSALPPLQQAAAEAAELVRVAEGQAASGGEEAGSLLQRVRSEGMVFEIGITFTFLHYQHILMGVMRCAFQSFRPILILFIFGQILKAAFFLMGAPMFLSFYSVWLFEVVYGLAQCMLSFIFISLFYNNLSFARIRPTVGHMCRQHRERLARAARAVSGGAW